MQCPRCQQENRPRQRFCGECGTTLQRSADTAQRLPSYADMQRSLTEALARESATGEILRMIRDSPTNEQAVFEVIVSSAWRLQPQEGGSSPLLGRPSGSARTEKRTATDRSVCRAEFEHDHRSTTWIGGHLMHVRRRARGTFLVGTGGDIFGHVHFPSAHGAASKNPLEDHLEPLEVAGEALQPLEFLLMDPWVAGLVVLVPGRESLGVFQHGGRRDLRSWGGPSGRQRYGLNAVRVSRPRTDAH